jgi:prepilin-type N-terminal cleavage/methylation domain-containing protein/prepilin-type processing-associated H-X9-DG protein
MSRKRANSRRRAAAQKSRAGFTLVELLVVIAIIGMLIGLLLPAVNTARETGRRITCSSQVRQLAQATMQYELTRKAYPGYANYTPMLVINGQMPTPAYVMSPAVNQTTQTSSLPGTSFIVELLPNLERTDLYTAWRTSSSSTGQAATQQSAHVYMNILNCPTNPPANTGNMPLAYVCNTGCQDNGSYATGGSSMSRDLRANGVFFDRLTGDPRMSMSGSIIMPRVSMTSDFITNRDGAGNTIMFSENADAGSYTDVTESSTGFIWDCNATPVGTQSIVPGGAAPSAQPQAYPSLRPNDPSTKGQRQFQSGSSSTSPYGYARPSSYHPNGMNVVFCDARTIFMGDQIEYYVFCLLMTPDGKNAMNPNSQQSGTLLMQGRNWAVPLDETWVP